MGQWDELLEAVNDATRPARSADPIPLIRKIISALVKRQILSKAVVKQFGEKVKANSQHLTLDYDGYRFTWMMKPGNTALNKDAHLLRQAEDLLLNEDLGRLKICEGEGCTIVFVDESKNQSRRWCSMEHCGMLLKSKRYYDTHRRKK